MATKIGIGYSNTTDSFLAGVEVAKGALREGFNNPSFAFLFCSGKHNASETLKGVRSILKNVNLIGGSAMGVITPEKISYDGFEASLALFESDEITFKIIKQGRLNDNEYAAGKNLAEQINSQATDDDKSLLIFYDSIKQSNPPLFNFATYLLNGLEENLKNEIHCAGGGLLADMQLNTCYQFYNDELLTQHIVGVLIGGNCLVHSTIIHGCKPVSSYRRITRVEGPVVYEIDDRPALEVIDEMFSNPVGITWKEFPLFVTLGVNKGNKYSEFKEIDYANKLTLAVIEEQKALVMFEPDLKNGDDVQLMQRSIDKKYITNGIETLKAASLNKKPLFYFYINCAGRAKPYSGCDFEDAEEILKEIGPGTPAMGFYSGVEISKIGNKLQPLDWTGVLYLITEA